HIEQECRCCTRIGCGSIDSDTVNEDHVSFLDRTSRDFDSFPFNIRVGVLHGVDHPTAFSSYGSSLQANRFTAPASAEVNGANEAAFFKHLCHKGSRGEYFGAVQQGCGVVTG